VYEGDLRDLPPDELERLDKAIDEAFRLMPKHPPRTLGVIPDLRDLLTILPGRVPIFPVGGVIKTLRELSPRLVRERLEELRRWREAEMHAMPGRPSSKVARPRRIPARRIIPSCERSSSSSRT
jgi:hypothetical protein